jgi:transcription elongation factor Elf1
MTFPCPTCKNPLGLTLEFIMKNPICVCPHCQTSFNFTVNEDIIKTYKETMSEIEKIKGQYKGTVKFS